MVNPALEAVLAGSVEDSDLRALYLSTTNPENEVQHAFHLGMKAIILISSDGFEKLFEHDRPCCPVVGARFRYTPSPRATIHIYE